MAMFHQLPCKLVLTLQQERPFYSVICSDLSSPQTYMVSHCHHHKLQIHQHVLKALNEPVPVHSSMSHPVLCSTVGRLAISSVIPHLRASHAWRHFPSPLLRFQGKTYYPSNPPSAVTSSGSWRQASF